MAFATPWVLLLLLLPLVMVGITRTSGLEATEVVRFPAMFVFGDSLLDPGNNNHLTTLAKANFYPYGIDFPNGTTGRFCNGMTTADHLSALLGLPMIPAYNNPTEREDKLQYGVNFASAGGGIFNDTGKTGELYSMDDQIQNFQLTLESLRLHLEEENTSELISKSLFFIYIGLNDYICNYFLPFSEKARQYTPETYASLLIQEFRGQLKKLYDLGARKLLVGELGPLGCIPNSIASESGSLNACVEEKNQLVKEFNSKLKSVLIPELSVNLTGANLLHWDSYGSTIHILNNFQEYGFKYARKACCGVGRANGRMLCFPGLQCRNRSEYIFWDPYHPSDRTNAILAKSAYQVLLSSTGIN